jgi:hypothetical protein
VRRAPGAAKRALGDARVWVWVAATGTAEYLGARSVRGLLIASAAWFGFLAISNLALGRPQSWMDYAGSAGGYVAGCIAYKSAKRALASWAAARRG